MPLPQNESGNFDTNGLLVFLYKWRKHLFLIAGISLVASVIFSSPWFIVPLYKSTVIMFPTSSNSISKSLLTESKDVKQDILQFGEEEQTEQLLQILNSNLIRERVISQFKLLEHYGIDPGSKHKKTRLIKEYENKIKFRRTEYMAVKITVLDSDPLMASRIANTISDLLDSTKNQMQKERAMQGFRIVENAYYTLVKEVRKMEDSLTTLRGFGVHDYESQVEMINQQLAIELAKGNVGGVKRLESKLNILAKYGGPYVSLRDALEHEKKHLSEIKALYEEAKIDAFQVLPQKFVVNKAEPAEIKSYPIRWLIVVVSLLSALMLGVLVLIAAESFGGIKKKLRLPIE